MTKYQSMMGAINHQEQNSVPMCIHLTVETYEAYGDRLLKDFYNAEVMKDLENGLITKEDAVNLSIGNCMIPITMPWWGWDHEKFHSSYNDPYEVPEMMPPTNDYGDLNAAVAKAKYIKEKYNVYIACLIFGSHWEKAYFTRGIENFLADIAGAKEFAQDLLDFIIDKNMKMLPDIVECEYIDGILLGSDWGTQNDLIMSPDTWREMIKQGEKVQYDLIKKYNKHVMVHSCGNILKVFDDIIELGVDILNPVQPECMDIAFLKETYGDKITFWGGISTQRTLPYGTAEEVAEETERTIKLLGEHGGYITAPSQEIQLDVPYENLVAMIKTARQFV